MSFKIMAKNDHAKILCLNSKEIKMKEKEFNTFFKSIASIAVSLPVLNEMSE